MAMTEFPSGGIQEAAAIQYVYLDFDGEITGYHGEILTIDRVEVKDSQLSSEEINDIVTSLNAQYADTGVVFVTARPLGIQFSTVYVGYTGSFAEYGNFAGLAETIDHSNLNPADNAFVILSGHESPEAVIRTIAHETEHLVSGLDHGGEGLDAYAARYDVTSGVTSTGLVLTNHSMYISSGGVANSTTVNSGGWMFISNGGVANSTTVNSNGFMYISSGGVASCTTVNYYGHVAGFWNWGNNTVFIEKIIDGNVACTIDNLSFNGTLSLASGGIANSTVVCYGDMSISSGGVANSTWVKSGYMYISSGGVANSTTVGNSGSMVIYSEGVANSTTVKYGGMSITSGGVANSTTVWASSYMFISSGGVANSTTVNSDGYVAGFQNAGSNAVFIEKIIDGNVAGMIDNLSFSGTLSLVSGGVANSTTVKYGAMFISRGGVANNTTVNANGYMYISSGGTATNIIASAGAQLGVTVAADTYIAGTYNGSAFEMQNASIFGFTVVSGGYLRISSGGTATNIIASAGAQLGVTVVADTYIQGTYNGSAFEMQNASAFGFTMASGGYMDISSGGVANSTTVNYGGRINISSGGTATDIIASTGARLGITVAANTYIQGTYNGSAFEMQNASAFGFTVNALGYMTISSGGTANSTTVNAGGSMTISSGGTANSTTVNASGYMYISSGGVANSTTVNYLGFINISRGGVANSTTVNSNGLIYISNGAVANSTTVNDSGYIYISSEGVANSTTVKSSGYIYIFSGGVANSTTVKYGGYLYISSGGVANTVNAAGSMCIFSGGVANSTAVNGGTYIFSGGIANNNTVNYAGYMYISSGGVANSTTVNSYGDMYISSGGVANSTTVNSIGIMIISSGGTATNIIASAEARLSVTVADNTYIQGTYNGSAFEMQNASAFGFTVASGGGMDIFSGGVANSTTVNSGGHMYISSGGTATNIIASAGARLGITVAADTYIQGTYNGSAFEMQNASAFGFTVNYNGHMYISSGGIANGTTVNSGGYMAISSGGIANSTTLNSGGYVAGFANMGSNAVIIGKIIDGKVAGTIDNLSFSGTLSLANGGIANRTTVNRSGYMTIISGGVANSTTVNSYGFMYISSGGFANSTTVNSGGDIYISNGGTANSTTMNSYGCMYISSGGIANSTTVKYGGDIYISNGGTANSTTVNSYGFMYISSGGTATNIIASAGARIGVTVAADTYIQGTYNGSAFEMQNASAFGFTVNSNYMYISSGGVANSTTVNYYGSMYISSGGVANSTTVNSGGAMYISKGGVANSTTVSSRGVAYVSSRGTVDGILVNSGGALYVSGGGTATKTAAIDGGKIFVSSGAVAVLSGGSGGYYAINLGANVTAYGNDFSSATFALSGSGALDLSGNYWGTDDLEVVLAKFGNYAANITINDLLLVDPNKTFSVAKTDLNNNYMGINTSSITLTLSHKVDASTVTPGNLSFTAQDGRSITISSYTVDGNVITIHFDPLTREGNYTLTLSDGIKNIAGDSLTSVREATLPDGVGEQITLKADFTCPRVVKVTPEGDLAGTLSSFVVYFSGAVDPATLAGNVLLVAPDGRTITPASMKKLNESTYEFAVAPQTAYGRYQVKVLNGIVDFAGNQIDQNGNGTGGEAGDGFTQSFNLTEIDLRVRNAAVSDVDLTSGEAFSVNWEVVNNSGYALSGSWTDGVYLSRDARWDVDDTLLGSVGHTGGLALNQAATGSLNLQLGGVLPGDYYLLVRSDIFMQEKGDKTAAEHAQNLEAIKISVSIPRLTVGESVTDQIEQSGDSGSFVVRQEANESLKLVLDSLTSNANMEIYVGYGYAPTRERFDAVKRGFTDRELTLAARAAAGDVYIMVYNKSTNAAFDYRLTAQNVPLSITSITPPVQGKSSDAVFDVYGIDFTPGMTVKVVGSDGREYTPSRYTFVSSTRVKLEFAAGVLNADTYDLVFSSGSETARKDDAITITGQSGSKFTAELSVPGTVGYHLVSTLNLTYANTGYDPMAAPLVVVTPTQKGREGALLTLDKSLVNQGFWTSVMPAGFTHSVQILATGKTAGILQPDPAQSQTVTVPIYYTGWQQPWDFSYPPIEWNVGYITVDNTDKLDWSDFLAAADFAPELKARLAANLKLQAGDTWGAYVRMLNANLAYLDDLDAADLPGSGDANQAVDITRLFNFELKQAKGDLTPVKTLAAATDAAPDAPGLALTFTRSFASDLASRYEEGILGYGWSNNWDLSLKIGADGTLTFDGPGANDRIYQPDYRGGYVNTSGDRATVTKLANGSYRITDPDGASYLFDATGRLASRADADGNTITARYNAGGQLIRLTHSGGAYLTLEYDAGGRLALLTDSAANRIAYTYDAAGNLVKVGNLTAGTETAYSYAADHALAGIVGADGNRTVYTYNDRGLLASISERGGAVYLKFSYGSAGEVTITDQSGNRVTNYYDENGNLLKTVDEVRNVNTIYRYDDQNRLISTLDSQGNSTSRSYDRYGNLASLTDALGNTANFVYNADGTLRSVTDGSGNTTDFRYDARGNLTATYYADGAEEHFSYDSAGNLVSSTDVRGTVTTYTVDAAGRVTTTESAGLRTAYTYDGNGFVSSVTDAADNTSRYSWTADGKMTAFTDARGNVMNYTYDAAGNLASITYADGSCESWSYNAAGDLTGVTNRRGETIGITVDDMGRVTGKTADGATLSYNYDAAGKIVSVSGMNFSYDQLDQLTGIEFADGRKIEYAYDRYGRTVSVTDEAGRGSFYSYTQQGSIDRLTDETGALVVDYDYDTLGRISLVTNGNGSSTVYTYDASGSVAAIDYFDAAGAKSGFVAYTYDDFGRTATERSAEGTWSYAYDAAGRLTGAVFTDPEGTAVHQQSFEYDAAGNRTQSVIDGEGTVYTYNNLNQIVSANCFAYRYDADGNLLEDEKRSYTWNAENRVVSETDKASGKVWEYSYDAFGNRTGVTVDGVTTTYTVDAAGNVLAEYLDGVWQRGYYQGNGLAGFTGGYAYQLDAKGSTRQVTGGGGTAVNTYRYDAWGNLLSSAEGVANNFTFVGGYGLMSNDSGTCFVRARNYDPETGRWTSADPIGISGGENLYVYCGNDSVNYIDFTGNGAFVYSSLGDFNFTGLSILGDITNKQLAHEFYKFDDGSSIGFGVDGIYGIYNGYGLDIVGQGTFLDYTEEQTQGERGQVTTPKQYNDIIMRQAYINVLTRDNSWTQYKLFGGKNCQDFASALRREYARIEKKQQVLASLPTNNINNLDGTTNQISNSQDPNDKIGPAGYGAEKYIAPREMDYTVRFENDPEWATSPARWIRVYDTLDEDFDLDTFEIKEFCLAGNYISVGGGRDSFNQNVTLNIEGQDVLVEVKINLDRETRQLVAEFMALDPDTGWMLMDPANGILFPNDDSGRGDGHIRYVISPREDLPTGTKLTNGAQIYFDFNDPIDTPVVENTIDSEAPAVLTVSISTASTYYSRTVSWTAADNQGGSGIAGFQLQYSLGEGDWIDYGSIVTGHQAVLNTPAGQYQVRVRAVDNVGNVGEWTTQSFTIHAGFYDQQWSATVTDTSTITLATESLSPGLYLLDGLFAAGLNAKITVTDRDTGKAVFTAAVGKGSLAANLKPVLLSGDYAITIVSTDSARSTGSAQIELFGEVFVNANQAQDDAWITSPVLAVTPQAGVSGEWVGFGDTLDYRRVEVADSGYYTFELSGLENTAKLTVYAVNKGVLQVLKSLTVSPKFDINGNVTGNNLGNIANVLLAANTDYYVAVEATGAAMGQNTGYNLDIGQFAITGKAGAENLTGSAWNDLFQANPDGVWSSAFNLKPIDCGDGSLINLGGYRRTYDTFDGGEGYDRLKLTGDNDALFLDDIYSPIAGIQNMRPRLLSIEEIRGGAGNDLVDLSSQRWNYGDARLLGEAGDDILLGNHGDDLLWGGTGNDRLDGGHGDDVYVFEANWGNDTVTDGDGNFRLVFEQSLEGQLQLSDNGRLISCGDNTVSFDREVSLEEIVFVDFSQLDPTESCNRILLHLAG